jgi:hypothetical protein
MVLSSGSRLGPYEIVAPIGAGGMREVWKARDPRLGREVAIKGSAVLSLLGSRSPTPLRAGRRAPLSRKPLGEMRADPFVYKKESNHVSDATP